MKKLILCLLITVALCTTVKASELNVTGKVESGMFTSTPLPPGIGSQLNWLSISDGFLRMGTVRPADFASDTVVYMQGSDSTLVGMGITTFRTLLNSGYLKIVDTASMLAGLTLDRVLQNGSSSGRNATVGTLTATTLGGTLSTTTQPNITSLGTLTLLTVSGMTTSGSVNTGVLTATRAVISGNETVGGNLSVTGYISAANFPQSLTGYALTDLSNVTTTANLLNTSGVIRTAGITATGNIEANAFSSSGVSTSKFYNVNAIGLNILPAAQVTDAQPLVTLGSIVLGGFAPVVQPSNGPKYDVSVNRLNVTNLAVTGTVTATNLSIAGIIIASGLTTSGSVSIGANLNVTNTIIAANITSTGKFLADAASGLGFASFLQPSGTVVYNTSTGGTLASVTNTGLFTTGSISGAGITLTSNASITGIVSAAGLSASGGISIGAGATLGGNLAMGGNNITGGGTASFTTATFSGSVTVSSASTSGFIVNSTNAASLHGFVIQTSGTAVAGMETLANTGEIKIGGYQTTSDYYPVIYSDGVAALTFGIGATPSATFVGSVTGAAASFTTMSLSGTSQVLNITGGGTSAIFAHWSNTGNDGYIGLESAAGASIAVGSTGYALVINSLANKPVQIGTNNTVRLTIDGSGNVGIGTTSPNIIGSGYGVTDINGANGGGIVTSVAGTAKGYYFSDASSTYAQAVGSFIIRTGGSTTALTINTSQHAIFAATTATGGYTVATLPAGTIGMQAYVTDALAPGFLTIVVGGGAVKTPVFYNGTNWVAF